MSDQGRWWKLWCSALHDDDLDNLPIADFGRYCKLGAHIKEQGNSGTITLKPPAKTLLSTLQLVTFDELIAFVKTIPNISHTTASQPTVTLTVTYHNWKKFQEDTSAERTREWRKRKKLSLSHPETTIEEKRGEEKRGEETPLTVQGGPGGNGLWPEDLGDVKQHLETVKAPVALHDPSYWLRIDTWLKRDGGYAVSYLDELDAYLAHQASQPKPQQHREPKRGLRNWLAKALHWSQSREQTEIFKTRYRGQGYRPR